MKYLLFSGSLRTESLNRKLISVVKDLLNQDSSNEIQVVDLRDFNIPVYDGDIEAKGLPNGVLKLGDMISKSEAIVISSPEYNRSIAGSLKNTIDWLSRIKPKTPLADKPILLMGASPGTLGATLGLNASRASFEVLGSYLYPKSFSLAKASEAFDKEGHLVDTNTKSKLIETLDNFKVFAKKLS